MTSEIQFKGKHFSPFLLWLNFWSKWCLSSLAVLIRENIKKHKNLITWLHMVLCYEVLHFTTLILPETWCREYIYLHFEKEWEWLLKQKLVYKVCYLDKSKSRGVISRKLIVIYSSDSHAYTVGSNISHFSSFFSLFSLKHAFNPFIL